MNDQVATTEVVGAGPSPDGDQAVTPYLNDLATAVCAPAMSLSRRDGQIRPLGVEGLYVQDLRALSQCELTVNGSELVPLGYEIVGGAVNEFHGAVVGAGNPGPDLSVFVTRRRVLNPSGMTETFDVKNFSRSRVTCRVELLFACDLAVLAVLRSGHRPAGQQVAAATDDGLVWDVPGRASVQVTCSPRPGAIEAGPGSVRWDFEVDARQAVTCSAAVDLLDRGAPAVFVAAPPGRTATNVTAPAVDASDQRLVRLLEVSLADLEGLRMVAPAHPDEVFLAAGAPWYLTLFGRDSIWAARFLLPLGRDLAWGTLSTLARRQGQRFDRLTSEEPGKILHEVRRPDMLANLDPANAGRRHPRAVSLPPVYYGTVDATALWVCLLHDAWRWGMPAEEVESLLTPMQRCLAWLTELGCGVDGFVRYVDESGKGLANQGWKDSWDAIQFRDGRIASAPLALCEVQAYAYEAATGGAELLEAFGREGADRWRDFAAGLAERFRARFWVEDEGGAYPAIALEADGTPVDSLTSNIGHLLGTGILNPQESELVARRLLGPDLNSGFGLRTLAASSGGFNPLSYHCGSVWAHDTAIAVSGLAGVPAPTAREAALSLIEGLLSAAEAFRYRLPELYGGHARQGERAPLPYPASCHPQAWAGASSVAIVAALLGIRPDVPRGTVALAPMAAGVGLHGASGLRVGDATVTARVSADGEERLTGGPPGLEVVG